MKMEIRAVPRDLYYHEIAYVRKLEGALERIAQTPSCGCKPCVGQCRSQAALEIELDAIRDMAREAIGPEKHL